MAAGNAASSSTDGSPGRTALTSTGSPGTQMLAAIFTYQLLVRHIYCRGNENKQVKWIMDCP
jgi:hypothetical protein